MTKPFDFIDRGEEIKLFKKMLARNIQERILALVIRPEKGKTYLMRYFFEHCRQLQVPVALVDFDTRERGAVYYWKFVRRVCDNLEPDNFPEVAECEERFHSNVAPIIRTGPGHGGTHFGTRGRFEEADFDRVSGRDLIQTGDVYYFGPQDQSAARQERLMYEMGCAFQAGLTRMCCQGRVVLLLDTYEDADRETRTWINEWVLEHLPDRYPNLVVVIAGRPELYDYFNQPRPWSALMLLREDLSPPKEEDVQEYIRINGLTVHGDEIRSFMKAAVYKISVMAKLRDAYKRYPRE